MKSPTLLIIDDDREFLKAQALALGEFYNVLTAEGVAEALQIFQENEIDCALVDYYLRDGCGHDVAKWAAANRSSCTVLLISARLDKQVAIDSFPLRIFDVLEKPYSLPTVQEKVRTALEETKRRQEQVKARLSLSTWELDRERRVFRCNGDSILLTSTEVKILDVLILAINQVVSRDKMIKAIWGNMSVADNTLDTHLTNLRKKAPMFKTMIKGVRGVGYIFEP